MSPDLNQLLSHIFLSIQQGTFQVNGNSALVQATQLLPSTNPQLINRDLVWKILDYLIDSRPFYLDYLKFSEVCLNAGLINPQLINKKSKLSKYTRIISSIIRGKTGEYLCSMFGKLLAA